MKFYASLLGYNEAVTEFCYHNKTEWSSTASGFPVNKYLCRSISVTVSGFGGFTRNVITFSEENKHQA